MTEAAATTSPRRRPVPPRVVLFWIVVITLIALGAYAVAPWVLPARIIEGPMVQMPSETGATLVWFLTRPAECTLQVTIDGTPHDYPVQATGARNSVRVDGLQPGRGYPYKIRCGAHTLFEGAGFRTNRTADTPFAFIVIGDSGTGGKIQYELAAQMSKVQPEPDFLLHTGDVVYPDGARRRYAARFFGPYQALLARIPCWPSLGNHDVKDDGGAAFRDVFELPANGPAGLPAEHNYWFDYASCRVAVIDSNLSEEVLKTQVAPWLQTVMSAAGPRWRFVVLHHPPYTGGRYASDVHIQHALVPVFDATGVDVVFNGHDHDYQRSVPLKAGQPTDFANGAVQYIVTGAGGAKLYEPKHGDPNYIAAADFQHHSFTLVRVNGDELRFEQVFSDGQRFDPFVITKSPPATPVAPTTTTAETPGT